MGSDFAQYAFGAYNHLQEKKKKDEEEAFQKRLQDLQLKNAEESAADREARRKRNEITDGRQDEEWKWGQEDRDETKRKRYVADFIRPYVPGVSTDPTTLNNSLDVSIPAAPTIAGLSSGMVPAGVIAAGVPKLQESFANFQSPEELEKARQAKLATDNIISQKRAMADAGLIRDYNKAPIGSRSSRASQSSGNIGGGLPSSSKDSALGVSPGLVDSTPIAAPTIKPFSPYKKYSDAFASDDEANLAEAMLMKIKAERPTLSDSEAKLVATRNLNIERQLAYQNSNAAAQQQAQRAKQPKRLPTTEEAAAIYKLFTEDSPVAPAPASIASDTSVLPPAIASAPIQAPQIATMPMTFASFQNMPPAKTMQNPAGMGPQLSPPQSQTIEQRPVNITDGLTLEERQRQIIQKQLGRMEHENSAFGNLNSAISTQLGRSLNNDERGYLLEAIANNKFSDLSFNWQEGTFTAPGDNIKRPLKDLLSGLSEYSLENAASSVAPVRSRFAEWLKEHGVLTDKGAQALSGQ